MKLKQYILIIITVAVLAISCKKESLDLKDPVRPTVSSVATESGIFPFSLGIWNKAVGGDYWAAAANHSIMGDEFYIPWGNYGWRWVSQVAKITLPNGTVVNNPIGPLQKDQLQSTNSREAGDVNAFLYEWKSMYFTIATSNVILSSSKTISFSGDAATKRNVLQAWAYYWRGWAYSRLGSIYLSALINNSSGASNFIQDLYVDRAAIITEANKNLDSAATILATVTANATYTEMMGGTSAISIIPAFCNKGGMVSPANWVRLINTQKARNFLVNRKTKAMTAADWATVQTLASTGMIQGDKSFTLGFTADGLNDVVGQFWTPSILLSDNNGGGGWYFVSERLVQEYKTGDARKLRDFGTFPGYYPTINPRSRGIQFGTSWYTNDVEDGGTFTTKDNSTNVQQYVSASWEENELMLAEAKINQGAVEAGLVHVDRVRTAQGAGAAVLVTGTGLSQAQAREELRRERRVALFLRGVSFYDARRWSVTEPASSGGGRANANVLVPANFPTAATGYPSIAVRLCFMEYNYMDYWDVPRNELDFNTPAAGSAAIKN